MPNSDDGLSGYRGAARDLLAKNGLRVGDLVSIVEGEKKVEGVLMPRTAVGDEQHIVVKLGTGYNVGVKITHSTRMVKIGEGQKPAFTRPPPPRQRSDLPRVAVMSTGGTIASKVDYRTGAVEPALTAEDLYSVVPELSEIANIQAEVLYSVFSENFTPEHWSKMATSAVEQIERGADGVVIAQGTDTLGYSAAALSFAIQELPVPVLIVGAQRSSDRPSSDAATNLIGAVSVAASAPFAAVGVAMHDGTSDARIAIHRGTKVRKCHTSRRDAFRSVNAEPIAYFDLRDRVLDISAGDLNAREKSRKPKLCAKFDPRAALVKFHPGMDGQIIDWLAGDGCRGLILEGTGLGHVSEAIFPRIRNAVEKGIFVGMTSQCLWGTVNMNVYSTGRDLQQLGVVPLSDMLPETALVKLMWALGNARSQEVRELMLTNIAGEFSNRRASEDTPSA